MSKLPLLFLLALPFIESPALAEGPVGAEPAPPAQRQAPPDKIAPSLQLKSQPLKPETTGEAGKELKPGEGQNTRIDKSIPSSPADVGKCGTGKSQEQSGPEQRCP